MAHVASFTEFINEQLLLEMPYPGRHGRHRWSHHYREADNPYIDEKDRYRARTLKNGIKGKVDPDPNGGAITIGNARKMAKLITDTSKLLPRMEAIAAVYPNNPAVIRPFIDRILELLPRSKYATAFELGKADGKFEANPNIEEMDEETMLRFLSKMGLTAPELSARSNHAEQLVYQAGYDEGFMSVPQPAVLPNAEQPA
jgi:hypothetical protein